MFSTVRYFVKTSIIFLFLGILSGVYMLIEKYLLNIWPHPEFVSAHTHVILVGSVMMMIMGVALWFFPRAEKNDPLYQPALILITYYALTISTGVRFVFQIVSSFSKSGVVDLLIVISGIVQVLGIILFFISMWGRIRSVGSHLREAKGEKF